MDDKERGTGQHPAESADPDVTAEPGEAASLGTLLTAAAAAAGLQEGEAGALAVLRAIGQLRPASTRAVARQAGLPVPVAAAVSNELRQRGLVTRDRPSTLTGLGRDLLAGHAAELPAGLAAACGDCGGHGITVPDELAKLAGPLAEVMARGPRADLALDQSHATAQTKLRRLAAMIRYGLLPARSLLILGDDDLMAVTIAAASALLGQPLVRRLAVADVSAQVLDFTAQEVAAAGLSAEVVEHDLRQPLPAALAGGFELAMTDPPYTPPGAQLFLSRAAEGLAPGPGRSVLFSFGPKGPDDTLAVQQGIADLGLTIQALHRDFNDYHGAGALGGRSHLYWLASTLATPAAAAGPYAGPLYTADLRGADRTYLCLTCRGRIIVGPGAAWRTIAELKQAGCPHCGGQRLRPLQLAAGSPEPLTAAGSSPRTAEGPGRPASGRSGGPGPGR